MVYDKYLNITTQVCQKDTRPERSIFYPYEPTPYSVIEELFTKYPFADSDHLVDFGSGKGRLLIMAAYYSCKNITGYEINSDMYQDSLKNIESFKKKHGIISHFSILNENAEKIVINDDMNKFYFFNPFHLKVFIKISRLLLESLKKNKRTVYLYLHRPFIRTIDYMNCLSEFELLSESKQFYLSQEDSKTYPEFLVYSSV